MSRPERDERQHSNQANTQQQKQRNRWDHGARKDRSLVLKEMELLRKNRKLSPTLHAPEQQEHETSKTRAQAWDEEKKQKRDCPPKKMNWGSKQHNSKISKWVKSSKSGTHCWKLTYKPRGKGYKLHGGCSWKRQIKTEMKHRHLSHIKCPWNGESNKQNNIKCVF